MDTGTVEHLCQKASYDVSQVLAQLRELKSVLHAVGSTSAHVMTRFSQIEGKLANIEYEIENIQSSVRHVGRS
jgi:phage shock protein A